MIVMTGGRMGWSWRRAAVVAALAVLVGGPLAFAAGGRGVGGIERVAAIPLAMSPWTPRDPLCTKACDERTKNCLASGSPRYGRAGSRLRR
jgi:hypothetical protein